MTAALGHITDAVASAPEQGFTHVRSFVGDPRLDTATKRENALVDSRTAGAELYCTGALVGTMVEDRNGDQWTKTHSVTDECWMHRPQANPTAMIVMYAPLMFMPDYDDYVGPFRVRHIPAVVSDAAHAPHSWQA